MKWSRLSAHHLREQPRLWLLEAGAAVRQCYKPTQAKASLLQLNLLAAPRRDLRLKIACKLCVVSSCARQKKNDSSPLRLWPQRLRLRLLPGLASDLHLIRHFEVRGVSFVLVCAGLHHQIPLRWSSPLRGLAVSGSYICTDFCHFPLNLGSFGVKLCKCLCCLPGLSFLMYCLILSQRN